MADVLSVGIIFRATKGQAGRGEPNPTPFVSSNGLQGLCEMALFFLVLFSPKPHLHDKQCHFEAACVILAYLSLIPDLLLPPLSFLSSFHSNSLFCHCLSFTLYPFHLSLISASALKSTLWICKEGRTFQHFFGLGGIFVNEY